MVSLWETVTRAMAIDLLQAATPVPAQHDGLSSAHAILCLWQLPGPAQPRLRAAWLAVGTPLPPLWGGSCPPAPHWARAAVTVPTALPALSQKDLGKSFQGIYTSSKKMHRVRCCRNPTRQFVGYDGTWG